MTLAPEIQTNVEQLRVSVYASNEAMGQAAAEEAAGVLRSAIREKGSANAVFASANSQLTFLAALRNTPDIDWRKVRVFHMDDYIGLPEEHPARFSLFLQRALVDQVEGAMFYPLAQVGQEAQDIEQACRDYERLLREHPADLCACGIGENGHLAFNDPPYADFEDTAWVKLVEINDASRKQQVGEGHFATLDEVPRQAITMTISALLAAKRVVCIVPETRKAAAVALALKGPITTDCPASILRRTPHAHLYLDRDSAGDTLA